jgi:hypothetical protein
MLGVAGIRLWFFSSILFTYRPGVSSMNFNVLENPLAALFAVAAIFIGYYALDLFHCGCVDETGAFPNNADPVIDLITADTPKTPVQKLGIFCAYIMPNFDGNLKELVDIWKNPIRGKNSLGICTRFPVKMLWLERRGILENSL